jgi:SEC-C motif-containing protein
MSDCHCGSGQPYELCCGPVLSGERPALTAEDLMRARYSAYVEKDIDFLGNSLHPAHRGDWDRAATERWANAAEWLGLEVRETVDGQAGDEEGTVEFVASFREHGAVRHHQELGRFAREDGAWFYVEGDLPRPATQRNTAKVGRNEPCPCGSGKKYKKCCGA